MLNRRRSIARCRTRTRAVVTTLLVATLAGAGAFAGSARAQAYPARAVTLICPYGPGTGIDLIGRILAQKLGDTWGQAMVVRNQPGASGAIGAEAAARAAPDGYTLAIMATSHIINQHMARNVKDVVSDFAPVAPVGSLPHVLAVPAAFPAKSIKELIAYAKARPGEVNFAALSGSATWFLGMLLKSSADIDIRHVAYKSTTDALPDVLAGRVPVWFTTVASAIPLVKAGKIRVLGITSGEKRASVMPDVPSMIESGLPALDISQGLFILAPLGTPPAIIAKLNADITRAVGLPEVRERLATEGAEPRTATPAALGAELKSESARWAKLVKDTGLRSE